MTYPKCHNPGCAGVARTDVNLYVCDTCADHEFCCNVSKDRFGTKTLWRVVAQAHPGLSYLLDHPRYDRRLQPRDWNPVFERREVAR